MEIEWRGGEGWAAEKLGRFGMLIRAWAKAISFIY